MKEKKQYSKIIIIISSGLFAFAISCKKDTPIESRKSNNIHQSTVFVKFDFPDTVYINKSYKGKIEYKSILDTITTNVLEEVDGINRYIMYSLTRTKNLDYDTMELYKIKLDTFGAIDNRTIPFYDIKFTELGVHYIDGIINDHATINTLPKSQNPNDKVRYIVNEARATHKVIVIDRK